MFLRFFRKGKESKALWPHVLFQNETITQTMKKGRVQCNQQKDK